MNNNQLGVSDAGSVILGAGITQLTTDLKVALALVGFGVLLKVLVAFLQKNNVPISGPQG